MASMASMPAHVNVPWPAWGPRLLESDVDFDCADEINVSCDLELPKSLRGNWEVSVEESRSHLNGGSFNELFNKYKERGIYYKTYGGKYHLVILVVLAMQFGTTISAEQLAYARSIYKSAGLFQESIDQFAKALDNYPNDGTPYDFKPGGVYDKIHEANYWNLTHPGSERRTVNHHGLRFFEDGKGTTEDQRRALDLAAPESCTYCGVPSIELPQTLKRCGKCKKARYCSRTCQEAEFPIHKKYCYTLKQQREREMSGDGPAKFTIGPTADGGLKHTAYMVPTEERKPKIRVGSNQKTGTVFMEVDDGQVVLTSETKSSDKKSS